MKRIISLLAVSALLSSCHTQKMESAGYDERPYNTRPIMERPAWPNYDIDNENSFAVFSQICPVVGQKSKGKKVMFLDQGPSNGRYTLYRCHEATYVVYEYLIWQDWCFFCFYEGKRIVDADTGDEYLLREVERLPLNQCFWIHGQTNQWVRFVLVFPPLPDTVKRIQFFNPGGPGRKWLHPMPERSEIIKVASLRPQIISSTPKGRIIY